MLSPLLCKTPMNLGPARRKHGPGTIRCPVLRLLLVLACLWVCLKPAASSGPVPPSPPPSARLDWPRDIRGYGLTLERAKQDALAQVKREVTMFLDQQESPLRAWELSDQFVRQHLLDGPGYEGESIDLPDVGRVKTWHFRVNTPDLRLIGRLESDAQRGLSAGRHQWIAGLTLVGVVIVLIVAWAMGRWRTRKSAI